MGCGRMPGNPDHLPGHAPNECVDLFFGQLACPPEYRCGWHDWYGLSYPCDLGSTEPARRLNSCTAIVWELTITGTDSADLVGYEADGTGVIEKVAYHCDEFVCLGRNTFKMTTSPYPEHFPPGLEQICVVPYSSDWNTPCATKADACACGDAGWDNVCLDISGITCGSLAEPSDLLDLTRYFDGDGFTFDGVDLSGCMSDPGGPCGYFTGSICSDCDADCTEFRLAFLVWCDGTDWKVKIYCYDVAEETCTEICSTTATLTTKCDDGARFTFDCGSITSTCCPDCGGTVETECCPDDSTPATLYATFACAGCDCLDGLVATLTYAGTSPGAFGTYKNWTGSVTGPCGDLDITFSVDDHATGSEICQYEGHISGACTFNGVSTEASGFQCPITSIEFDLFGPGSCGFDCTIPSPCTMTVTP